VSFGTVPIAGGSRKTLKPSTERGPLSDQNSLRNEIPTVRPYGSRNAG
jgi:hypothetical protein